MEAADAESDIVEGAKVANIQVAVSYPIVSAYEFEFLKEEDVVRERLDKCTLYLLVQRPLTYFDNVVLDDGVIYFEIADGEATPLACKLDLVHAGICGPGEEICVETQYFTKTPGAKQPFRDVGAIKLFRKDRSMIVWWSPQKILYEMLVRGLEVAVADGGDPLSFLDFSVLYVGKAFDQKVWDRLTGHEKMQKILTVQNPVGAAPAARAPFEVSLILLSVVGLTDVAELPYVGVSDMPGVQTIVHEVDLTDTEAFVRFMSEPLAPLGDEAMTREVEAQLIHRFQPEYNSVLFKNYPEIAGGMRSKGYTWTDLTIEGLPASLSTPHFKLGPVVEIEPEDG